MVRSERHPRAFTLVELLVVIGIIGVLVAILLPTLSKAQEASRRVQCLSNLRQVYTAMMFYARDYHDQVPIGYRAGKSKQFNSMVWSNTSKQYVLFGLLYRGGYMKTPKVFFCPTENNPQSMFGTPINPWPPGSDGDPTIQGYCGYAMRPDVGIPDDPSTVPTFTFPKLYHFKNLAILSDLTATPERVTTRHNKGINVLYGNGGGHWVDRKVFDDQLALCPVLITPPTVSAAVNAAQDQIWLRLDAQ